MMQKWEYFAFEDDLPGVEDFTLAGKVRASTKQFLGKLGKEGWELVSVHPVEVKSKTCFYYFFKRPLPKE